MLANDEPAARRAKALLSAHVREATSGWQLHPAQRRAHRD
jgi:hypothetical protein